MQRGNDRPARRNFPGLVNVLPQLRVIRRQVRVAIHAAGQVQIAWFLVGQGPVRCGRRCGRRVRHLWGRRRQDGGNVSGDRIQHGRDGLAVDHGDLAAFLDAGGELSLDVLGRVGREEV